MPGWLDRAVVNCLITLCLLVTLVPNSSSLVQVKKAARSCTNCPLWKNATQTVFGEGKSSAKILIVGEQPGDQEDRAGRPFVGPAGKLLDRALEEAGINRQETYVTNAVKHFKWEPVGKRRLHKKPSARELAACRPWLEAEIRIIRPTIIVCLGATAAAALLDPKVRVLRDRGRVFSSVLAGSILITIHPSLLLRITDREEAAEKYLHFVADLRAAASNARNAL
ncbi:MAG TPA: UdgX family uracil-DNA binding protein, partial [Terrimicrobiaceae bacterium]